MALINCLVTKPGRRYSHLERTSFYCELNPTPRWYIRFEIKNEYDFEYTLSNGEIMIAGGVYERVSFEYVLNNSPPHIQEELLFHIDVFVPKKIKTKWSKE